MDDFIQHWASIFANNHKIDEQQAEVILGLLNKMLKIEKLTCVSAQTLYGVFRDLLPQNTQTTFISYEKFYFMVKDYLNMKEIDLESEERTLGLYCCDGKDIILNAKLNVNLF